MAKITRMDLEKKLHEKLSLTRADARKILSFIFEEMARALLRGDQVVIRGFGKFYIKQKKARMAMNPRTGEKILVPAKKVVKFRPAKRLKEIR